MPNIIQIEELVYTRLPRISKSEWLNMLSKQGVANDYALLLEDYLLIEQTDYRFSNGNYISSERTVYNIDYTTYDTAENTPNPDNTEEIITVRYDSTHDRYYVYYTHFPIEDITHTPDLSHILSEADMPIHGTFHQAPAEEQTLATPVTHHPLQPAPPPKPAPIPVLIPQQVVQTEQPKKKKWRRFAELEAAYKSGKSLDQIVAMFDCTPQGAIYQIKTYLGIENPFEEFYQPQIPQTPQPKETILGVDKSTLTPEQIELGESLERLLKQTQPWPKAKLKKLEAMYTEECSPWEIMNEFKCTREEVRCQLLFQLGYRNAFEELDKEPWTDKYDQNLLKEYVIHKDDMQRIADDMRRSVKKIEKRLFELVGRMYEGMPKLTAQDKVHASNRQFDWKLKKAKIREQIENEKRNEELKRRRRIEDEQKKENGFYKSGTQIVHHIYGRVTILKDDEKITKYLLKDGTKKVIRK